MRCLAAGRLWHALMPPCTYFLQHRSPPCRPLEHCRLCITERGSLFLGIESCLDGVYAKLGACAGHRGLQELQKGAVRSTSPSENLVKCRQLSQHPYAMQNIYARRLKRRRQTCRPQTARCSPGRRPFRATQSSRGTPAGAGEGDDGSARLREDEMHVR